MPYTNHIFAGPIQPCATVEHHYTCLDNRERHCQGHPISEDYLDNKDSLSDSSDEKQECSHTIEDGFDKDEDGFDKDEDGDGDGHDFLDQDDYIRDGLDLADENHVVHPRCTLDISNSEIMSRGIVKDGRYFSHEEQVPDLYEETAVYTSVTNEPLEKRPGRIRKLVGKAKEHLRDEENRKKAVQMFQNGVREVGTFIADVQTSDKGGLGGIGVGSKSNGKKLAKVVVKVAMQRLAK